MRQGYRKFGNKKTEVNGIVFDSKKEAKRYGELLLLERCKEIYDIKTQVPYELIPRQNDVNGKILERPCVYIADFTYSDTGGDFHVEDTKGFRTPDYILKRKLMLHVLGIRIEEV